MQSGTTLRRLAAVLIALTGCSFSLVACSNEGDELRQQNEALQAQIDELKSAASLVASTDPSTLISQLSPADLALFEYWQAERLNLSNLRDVLEEFEDRVAASEQFEYLIKTVQDAIARQSSLEITEQIPEIKRLAANWGSIQREYEEFNSPGGERSYCTWINGQEAFQRVFGDGPVPQTEKQDCSFPLRRGIDFLIQDLNSFKVWLETMSSKFDRLLP